MNDEQATPVPYSQEAEEAAIGAALVNGPRADAILALAPPEDYFILRLRYVAEAIKSLLDQKLAVDYLTVIDALKKANRLAEVGGPAYLTTLINNTPDSMNGLTYAELVNRAAIRRRGLQANDQWKTALLDQDKALEDVIAIGEKAVQDVVHTVPVSELFSMQQVMSSVWDRLEDQTKIKAAGGNGLAGLSSGLSSLDMITNGWQPEQFILIGGRPGMGKTAMMAYFATQVAKQLPKPGNRPFRVYFWSGEMSLQQLGRRFLSAETSIQGSQILTANLSPAENRTLLDGFGRVGKLEIYVDMTVRLTPLKLRRNIKRAQRLFGAFDLVVVDYCQLMRADGKVSGQEEELTQISRGLKEIAREFGPPVMSGAQLNRGVEVRDDKRPQLADLRGSGSLEQDADVVIFPFFESYYTDRNIKAGFMEIDVAKNRDGMTGTVKEVYCNFGLMQFDEGYLMPI